MKTHIVNTLLVTVATGSLMASGALFLQTQQLASQLDEVTAVLQNTQSIQANKQAVTANYQHYQSGNELDQQLAELNASIEQLVSQVQSDDANKPLVTDHAQQYEMEQQQQALAQLVSDSMATGVWTAADAERFSNHAIGLSGEVLEAMAAEVIRGLESGALQMDPGMMMPF